MPIPLCDLGAQYQPLKAEVLRAIEGVLDSMHLFLGPNTCAFESEFAAYCGTRDCVAVGSGTDALHLALRAASVGPGDEVITVSHTFFATAEAIWMVGARPVFVDIDPSSFTMDVDQVEARISSRTRAILPVHLYGQMAEMQPLLQVAERYGLVVIEDAAQAHGAVSGGRRAGAIGHLGCFSFYYSKNLGAYGEAGAVTTSDPELARRLRLLRDHGSEERYQHTTFGFNSRVDEIQAAILRVKLRHLDAWNAQRLAHAARYCQLLQDTDVQPPMLVEDGSHVYYVYVARCADRGALRARLAERGIETGIHFPVPIHLQPAARSLGYVAGDLPHAEQAAREVLSLPMYPELTEEQIACVADAVHAAAQSGGPAAPDQRGGAAERGRAVPDQRPQVL